MKLKTRILALVTASFMMLSVLCSCSDTSVALTVNGEDVPAGVYLAFLWNSYYNQYYQMQSSNSSTAITSSDFFDQKVDNKKMADWIKSDALLQSEEYVIINQLFDEYKLSLSDDEKTSIKSTVSKYVGETGENLLTDGISEASFEKMLTYSYKYQAVFNYLYKDGGENKYGVTAVSKDEIKKYCIDNYGVFNIITFSLTDSDGDKIDDSHATQMKALADECLKKAKAGENMDQLNADYKTLADDILTDAKKVKDAAATDVTGSGTSSDTSSVESTPSTAAAPEETSSDVSSATDSSKDTSSSKTSGSEDTKAEAEKPASNESVMQVDTSENASEYNKQMFALKAGCDPTLVTIKDTAYYVAVRYEFDDEHVTTYTDNALSSLKSEDYETLVSETILGKAKIVKNDAAIKRFDPKNITTIISGQ